MSELAPAPSRRQRMQARAGVAITDRDTLASVSGDDGLAAQLQAGAGKRQRFSSVEHTHSPLITAYDPKGNARQIPAMNLNMVLESGMDVLCPLCGGQHTDDGPNQCPARERLLQARCPICQRAIPEERVTGADDAEDGTDGDGDFVALPIPDRATREQQLLARVQLHATTYHPSEAFSRYGWRKAAESKE